MRSPLSASNGRSGSPLPFGPCKTGTGSGTGSGTRTGVGVSDAVDGAAATTSVAVNANANASASVHAHGELPMDFFLCSEDELYQRSDGYGDDSMYGVRSLAEGAVEAVFEGGETGGGDRGDRGKKSESSVGGDAGAGAGNKATTSTPDAIATAVSPVRRVLQDTLGVLSLPSTPTHFDVSLPSSTLPGSPKSVSVASMRSSVDDDDDDDDDEGASGEDYDKDDGNGQAAVLDIGGSQREADRRSLVDIPQFIMPSIMIPRRKPLPNLSRALCKVAAGKELLAPSTSEERLFDERVGSSVSSIPSWAIDFRRSMRNERQRSILFFDNELNLPIESRNDWDKVSKSDHITEPSPSPESSWAMVSTSSLYNKHLKKQPSDDLTSYSTCTSQNIESQKAFQNHHYSSSSPYHLYHQQTQHEDDPLGLCTLSNRLISISATVLKVLGGVGVVGVVVVALANIWAASSSKEGSSGSSSNSTFFSRFPCSFSVPGDGDFSASPSHSPSLSHVSTTSGPPFPSMYYPTHQRAYSGPGPGPGSVEEMSLAELVGAEILEWTGGIGGIWDFLVGGIGR